MTDIFPAIGAIYKPESLNTFEYPFSNIGFSDLSAIKFNDSRVIVHKNRITVGIDGPRGPQVFFSAEVQEVLKVPSTQFIRVITTDGHLVVFSRSKSCGCGSRLRSWNPYGNIVSA
jgi:hypothetical protein